MPRHIVRLIALMVAFVVAALTAKWYFTAESFYRFGHFRANSVPEIASQPIQYMTPAYCQSCHAERYAVWSANAHKTVICEVCHGPAKGHPEQRKMPIPTETIKLCSLCHEKMPGRPAAQPQVDIAQHSSGQECITCHNPHSPKLSASTQIAAGGDKKAGLAVAARCAGCHGEKGMAANPAWPNLAGQNPGYLAGALRAFKSGARVDAMMQPLAQALSDADIDNVAAYFASLACTTKPAKPNEAAAKLAARCSSCHGETGISANPAWPNLAGQNEAYVDNALRGFKSGARNDALMSRVAQTLGDADIAALASHFQSLGCAPSK